MNPSWWSQPFAAEGSAVADGIARQLGMPSLDPLTILVREAAQNSWDARLTSHRPVAFTIDFRRLGDRADAWRRLLLPGPFLGQEVGLSSALGEDACLIVVSDRETRGLGGPIRADEEAPAGVPTNFCSFVRNVGEPRDQEHGGGTYGFGKGIFFRLSRVGTIIVDTNTIDDLGAGRRLMGAALGPSFASRGIRHTGRHWWGLDVEGVPDPLTGQDAATVARDLGLPGFDDGRFGTDVVVVAPDLGREADEEGERNASSAAEFVASAILWHLWPKFATEEHSARMSFEVTNEGHQVALPEPRELSVFRPFVVALDRVRRNDGDRYSRMTPPRDAGTLALELVHVTGGRDMNRPVVSRARPFEPPMHHVARMRVPELVVDYFATPPHPDPLFGYVGVFRSSPDADEAFAASEPPTHDGWVDQGLRGSALGVVRNSRKFIRDTVARCFEPQLRTGAGSLEGLGRLATQFAGLLPTVTGSGSSPAPPASPRSGGMGRPRAPRISAGPTLHIFSGEPVLVARVTVPTGTWRLDVEATIRVEGGRAEGDAPAGAAVARVRGWRSPTGVEESGGRVTVKADVDEEWFVYAGHVPDGVVRFRLTSEAVDAT